jgi:phosphatidylglycerophosphatase A
VAGEPGIDYLRDEQTVALDLKGLGPLRMSLFKIKPELKRLNLKHPLHFLAVGFGSGLSPKAPGTMGTLAAIPLYLLVSGLSTPGSSPAGGGLRGGHPHLPERHRCHRHAGSRRHRLGRGDRFGVTMIAAPAGWEWVLAGFVLFRLFDMLKPWPISWFDRRIHGGLGIMLDDLIAGLFALFCMQSLAYWLG